jgi:hypothetical protein
LWIYNQGLLNICYRSKTIPNSGIQFPFLLFVWVFVVVVVFESGSHYVAHAGLELKPPPASTSWVLGLQVHASPPVFLALNSYLVHISGISYLNLHNYKFKKNMYCFNTANYFSASIVTTANPALIYGDAGTKKMNTLH